MFTGTNDLNDGPCSSFADSTQKHQLIFLLG